MPTVNELFLKFTDYCSVQYEKSSDKTAFMRLLLNDNEMKRLINKAECEADYESCKELLRQAAIFLLKNNQTENVEINR
jgi:hypothetical protein